MTHHQVTPEERHQLLLEQLGALDQSGKSYDSGNRWEAKRLATVAYLLCHDPVTTGSKKSRTKSLLGQMGHKTSMQFLSSASNSHPESIPWLPLVFMEIDTNSSNGWTFEPYLERAPNYWKWMSFSKWWDADVFRAKRGEATLSRKNLVFSLRDQDGGAHVDGHLTDAAYALLKTKNEERLEGNGKPIPNAHLACMRQIGFELHASISRFLSQQ